MLALHDLQKTMARAVLAGETATLRPELSVTGADALERFNIYRNHTVISLTDALETTFPVVMQVVDRRFFRWLAAEFVRSRPPAEPRLSAYGAELPRFIAQFEACRGLPFLADLARLEWAINTAIHATEKPALDLTALAGVAAARVAAGRLHLQPSLRFVWSRHPILRIWQAHQPAGDATVSLRRSAGEPAADRITVRRRGRGVALMTHHLPRFRLLIDLVSGRSLELALARSLARALFSSAVVPDFEPGAELAAVFREGLVTTIALPTINQAPEE